MSATALLRSDKQTMAATIHHGSEPLRRVPVWAAMIGTT